MKKIIATTLATAVVTSNMPTEILAENLSNSKSQDLGKQQIKTIKKGNIEVDINFDLPIKNIETSFSKLTLELLDGKDIIAQIPLGSDDLTNSFTYNSQSYDFEIKRLSFDGITEVKENEKAYIYRVAFKDLPADNMNYGISLKGNGFKDVSVDNIELDNYSKRIVLHNTLSDDKNGAFLFGDVNKDGKVNKTDYELVSSNIGSTDLAYDLNRDGKVSIADLAYVHKNMDKKQGKADIEDTNAILNLNNIDLSSPIDAIEGQQITGDVEDLFTDSGVVTLSVPEDKEMSEETPLKMELDLSSNGEAVLMEQIVIAGGENAPQSGSVIVDGVEYKFGTYARNSSKSTKETTKENATNLKSTDSKEADTNTKNTKNTIEILENTTNDSNIENGNSIPEIEHALDSELAETSNNEVLDNKFLDNANEIINIENATVSEGVDQELDNTNNTLSNNTSYTDNSNIDDKLDSKTEVETNDTKLKKEAVSSNKDTRESHKVTRVVEGMAIVSNGNIVVNLEGQKAVSKITINVTSTTTDDRNLCDIAKVEFLNNVYKEVPKPEMAIPVITNVVTSTKVAHEKMEITWDRVNNITGYEVKVEEVDTTGKTLSTRTFKTSKESLTVRDIKAYSIYRISVQSLNGEWQGGYKEATSSDIDGVPDNVVTSSIANGEYIIKPIDRNSIVEIMVVPEEKPEAPEGITIKGGYKELTVNWKKHNSAQSFDVYYRKLGDNSEFVKANDEAIINVTSYTISNLDENASYEVKMTATNHLGTSAMSKGYVGETTAIKIPITPNYKLINTPNGVNQLTSNIVSIEFPITAGNDHQGIFDEDCVVDNDYSTAWTIDDWDAGHYSKRGPIVTFSEEHTINRIAMIARVDSVGATPYMANIGVFNEEENKWEYHDAKISNYNNNGAYVILKLDTPITGTKFQVNPSVYGGNKLSISELKFYDYDDVEADVENLFADELKLTLRQESQEDNILAVTQEEIDAIRVKLNTKDIVSGEYHPERDSLLEEVLIAEQLLNDENLSEKIIEIDPLINGSGANTGYNNDWQALGFAAKAGDTIDIYLSNDQPNRDIYFGYEQHYGESGSYISSKKIVLKPGKNTIQIDSLHDINVEKGGNLYVRFPYNVDSSTAKIYVRVSGATEIPHLNLNNDLVDVNYMVNNKDSNNEDILEVKAKIKEYILSLKEHVNTLEDKYPKTASEKDNLNNIYTYDEKTSILNTTNIEGDRFTLTLPSTEIYKGITSGIENDLDAQIDRVYDAILAWEQIIQITNSKKGVYESLNDFNGNGQIDDEDKAEYNSNKASKSRVNVKYQRMFIGAFMYASGHHVGIDAGSSVSLMQGVPYKFNEDGTIANADEAKLFGWGIGHEIGHKADIVNRTYSETTNNLLPMLIQTFDMTTKSRLEENDVYTKIYEKVTSQSVGLEQDISTLLGMFWQLHLAYEDSATYEMLNNNNDNNPDNDSFFAKLNRAYRNTKAETTDKDQLLIRRASDAANKDLRAFFASWGLIADESTSIYLQEKFSESDRETRKIQYLNDEAFRKRIEGITDMSENTSVVASFDGVNDGDIVNSDSVTLNLNVNQDADKILGYEILRSDGNTNENGETKVKYREVGFVNANEDGSATFTDSIAPLNNRAITYKVVAYDYNLNPTEEFTVGSVKLSHDGSIDSNGFTLTSNLTSDIEGSPIENIKDGDSSTVFKARKLTKDEYNSDPHKVDNIDINADPYIIIDLKGSKSITGLKYTKSDDAISKLSLRNIFAKDTSFNAIDKYEIYISDDNKDFTKVSEGKFEFGKDSVLGGSNGDNIAKVLFEEDSNLMTYDARYVKLVAVGAKNIDIADIELIGTTGDNIEIGFIDATTNTKVNGVGRIDEDYVLQADNTDTLEDDSVIIPKDSIVIIGEYKGNPAFNIPLLIDKNNKTINGEVALMANVPEDAELGTVASGTWIYWLSKEDFNRLTDSVKAELYRYDKLVDGAPVGQRLVSDTLYTNITATDFNGLPLISIANSVNIDNELDTKVKKSTNTEVVYTNSKIITR